MSTTVTATFVFTDLADSTAIAARLGPAEAEELRQTHFRLLRGAAASSGGTEVKNLGDGLMLSYSSPSRALAGAVGMQQAVEHHNRGGGEPLAVRVGLSTGEATEEDGDYFGDAVVVAARLCAAAEPGRILASDLVRLMVGSHAAQTFGEVHLFDLKGLSEPVAAVEVQWEPAEVAGSVPLPGRLVGAATAAVFGFFGRGVELGTLEDARKAAAAAKRPHVVFVSGEAGMGKTSLVAQWARNAHADGAIVMFGHADEDLGVAYQPWIEALSGLVRDGRPEWVEAVRSAPRSALTRLVPEIASNAERVADPETERLLLLDGATELLAAAAASSPVVAASSPVVVVLDDLHWADAASLQLLRHVTVSGVEMPVTIVCTYRDTDLSRGDQLTKLLADMHRESNVSRIPLAGLDDLELCDLLAAAAGHDLDDNGVGLAHALRRETDGNPFFTAEILRHLSESGGIVLNAEGRWVLAGEIDELGLPNSVRDVVGRRVERLGDEALRVLCLGSVIGREFSVEVLAAVADIDEEDLLDLLDAAVIAAVLVESGTADRYRFAHALIQHSLYEELSLIRRQRTHQRIAEILERGAGTDDAAALAELAHHWVAATRPADLDKALGYVRRAGDAARDALAPDDAIRWYRQALELVARRDRPDEHLRAELLATLGATQSMVSRTDARDTLLEAAELAVSLDDIDVLVQAVLAFHGQMAVLTSDAAVGRIADLALSRVGTESTSIRAGLLSVLVNSMDAVREWRRCRELAQEALELARGADDGTFLDVLTHVSPFVQDPDTRDQTIADLARARTVADRRGDPLVRSRVRFLLNWACFERVDLDGVDTNLTELEELTTALGRPEVSWRFSMLIIGRLLVAGRTDDADRANTEALEFGLAAESPEAFGVYGAFLFQIRLMQGRVDEIVDVVLDAARENPAIAVLHPIVPFLLSEVGRLAEAHESFAAEAAGGFDYPIGDQWLSSMGHAIDAAVNLGEVEAARGLVERVAPYSTYLMYPAVVLDGAAARPLARGATLLGDYERAEEWFAIAHDLHTRMEARYWLALGQLDHADLCQARGADGDAVRARELATAAVTTAEEYGFAALARRAATILTA